VSTGFDRIKALVAVNEARDQYDAAFEVHATAEQLAAFWGEGPEAKTHRDALQMILQRGDEELNAQPLQAGAW
jgi:hypothetical protein